MDKARREDLLATAARQLLYGIGYSESLTSLKYIIENIGEALKIIALLQDELSDQIKEEK